MEHLLAIMAGSAMSSFLNWITTKLQTAQIQTQIKDVQHTVATQSVTLPVQVAKDVSKVVAQASAPSAPTDIKL